MVNTWAQTKVNWSRLCGKISGTGGLQVSFLQWRANSRRLLTESPFVLSSVFADLKGIFYHNRRTESTICIITQFEM